jgi:hypothetical protein
MNLFEVAQEITNRLARIFLRDDTGRRPVFGGFENFSAIPIGATTCCSTSTSMATTRPASAPVTKPGGRGSLPVWSNTSDISTPKPYCRAGSRRRSKKAKETFETGT